MMQIKIHRAWKAAIENINFCNLVDETMKLYNQNLLLQATQSASCAITRPI